MAEKQISPPSLGALDTRYLLVANNLSDLASASTARTNLGLVAGGAGDIWVEKAGDTMTGALQIEIQNESALFVGSNNTTSTFTVDTQNNTVIISEHSGESVRGVQATHLLDDALGVKIRARKIRGTGTPNIVQDDDVILDLIAQGFDGGDYEDIAQIKVEVDGTPGTDDMPGRIVFSTTADGANSVTERMRINAAGDTIITGNLDLVDDKKILFGTGDDGEIYSSSDDLYIRNITQDNDIIFQVNDGGSQVEVARFDGSEGQFLVTAHAAAVIPLVVKGAASQSANLQEWQDSNGANLIEVDSAGKMGIGIDPTELLHVYKASGGGTVGLFEMGTSAGALFEFKNTTRSWSFGIDSTEVYVVRDNETGNEPFKIEPGAPSASIVIDATGRVGLLTAAPGGDLHIEGQVAWTTAVALSGQDNLYLDDSAGTQGSGNYGASIGFSKLATSARRAAIAAVQTDSDADRVGFAFFTHPSASGGQPIVEAMRIDHNGNLQFADARNIIFNTTTGTKIGTATNQKLAFYNTTPVVQPTALTTALTQITHTGPSTPDYAIATPIDSGAGSAWGFSTQDEFETAMSVMLNLQTRVDELESKFQSLGLLA